MRAALTSVLIALFLVGASGHLFAETNKQPPQPLATAASGSGNRVNPGDASSAQLSKDNKTVKTPSTLKDQGDAAANQDYQSGGAPDQGDETPVKKWLVGIMILLSSVLIAVAYIILRLHQPEVSPGTGYDGDGQQPGRSEYTTTSSSNADITSIKKGVSDVLQLLRNQASADSNLRAEEHRRVREQLSNKEAQLGELRRQIEVSQSKQTQLANEAEQLRVEVARIDGLENELSLAKSQAEEARRIRDRERAEFEARFAAFFPQGKSDELAQQIGELSTAAMKANANASVSLASLAFMRSAETGHVEEEALLSVLRQFSESFAAFLKGTGCNASQVAGALSQWADELGPKFAGKIRIVVPSIGYPVDTRTMLVEGTNEKVTEVASWCLYNSKGGVYAAARVS